MVNGKHAVRPTPHRKKGGPTNYTSRMTRVVPQGAPSSPILFNMYIDHLVRRTETTDVAIRGDGAAIIVADDVLLQARTRQALQAPPLKFSDAW